MKLVPILVVIASLSVAATVSVVPVSVEASTANEGSRTFIKDGEKTVREWTSSSSSGDAAVRHSTDKDFIIGEVTDDPALQLSLERNTPGGPVITQETSANDASSGHAGDAEIADLLDHGVD